MSFSARAAMEFAPSREGEAAGIALVQSEDFQYRLELTMSRNAPVLRLVAASGGPDRTLAERILAESTAAVGLASGQVPAGRLVLEVEARGQELSFRFREDTRREDTRREGDMELLASGVDGRILSPEAAGGFVGTTIGMFASGHGLESPNRADFDWFEYR